MSAVLTDEDVRPWLRLVKRLAAKFGHRLPAHVEFDDLISWGSLGLLDALRKFDPARGLKFTTYAYPRINGAIIDGLRGADWVPASARRTAREAGEDIPPSLSLDEEWDHDGEPYTLADTLASADLPAFERVEAAEAATEVRATLARLPPREADILLGVDRDGFKATAARLGVSVSRVSQLRTRAIGRVRGWLGVTSLGIDGNVVRRLTLDGKDRAYIAARFGVTPAQLAKWCENHGVPRPPLTPTASGKPADPSAVRERMEDMRRVLGVEEAPDRCIVPSCAGSVLSKGLCSMHYNAHRRFVLGEPGSTGKRMSIPDWIAAGCPVREPGRAPVRAVRPREAAEAPAVTTLPPAATIAHQIKAEVEAEARAELARDGHAAQTASEALAAAAQAEVAKSAAKIAASPDPDSDQTTPTPEEAPAVETAVAPAPKAAQVQPVMPVSPFRKPVREGGIVLAMRVEGSRIVLGDIAVEGDITDVEAEMALTWLRGRLEGRQGVEVVVEGSGAA